MDHTKVSTEMIMGCKNPLCFIFSVTHVLVMCLAFLKAVTPANFLAVLTGDAAKVTGGSGKVLKSGPNDHVFVYFTDHGAPGLLAFPSDDYYYLLLLPLLFIACESGSMMNHLPTDIEVYATTAANPHESSYACYYDEKRDTYLGDWYSVNWMEDSDVEDLSKETLQKQFKIVKSHTNTSHVMQYGNKTLSHMKVVEFQGNPKASIQPAPPVTLTPVNEPDLTPSPDVPLAILKRKLMASNDIVIARKYIREINAHLKVRDLLRNTMEEVVNKVTRDPKKSQEILNDKQDLTEFQCYQKAVEHYKSRCFNWHKSEYEYALRQLYALVNLCENRYPHESRMCICP
uniref:Legumain n=1 Tax=Paramormyrops kingsleyae TaxID=1676925 RepID=A0A3B3SWS0_9TELE